MNQTEASGSPSRGGGIPRGTCDAPSLIVRRQRHHSAMAGIVAARRARAAPAALSLLRPTPRLARRGLCTPDPALAAFARQMEAGLSLGQRLDDAAPAESLRTRGYAVVDGLLGDAACRRMRAEAEALRAAGSYSQSYSEVAETGERIWRPGVGPSMRPSAGHASMPTKEGPSAPARVYVRLPCLVGEGRSSIDPF